MIRIPRVLPPLLALWGLLAPGAAPAARAAEPGEPFLVRDIDTTGEPYFTRCDITCPPPTPIYGSLIEQLTPLGDLLVFVANDRFHGFEPWVSDGTPEGTRLLADACPGDCGELAPQILGVLDGLLYFWSDRTEGSEAGLWVTDGTPEGTRVLAELCPGLCGRLVEGPAIAFEGALFFSVYHAEESRRYLWRTDGTAEGTGPILPVCSRETVCFEQFQSFFVYGGRLFFSDWADLRRLDDPDGEPAVAWSGTPSSAAPLGERMVLGVSNANNSSLWVMDGPLSEPRLVTHVGGDHLSQLTATGGLVYFARWDNQREALWRTDGTAAGTGPVVPELAGSGVDVVGVLGGGLVVRVFPDAGPPPYDPFILWRIDPDGSAELLADLPTQAIGLVRDRLFFSAEEGPAVGRELWTSDGTAAGTGRLADIAPGSASSEPGLGGRVVAGFARAGDLLFFPARHPDVDTELWALDLGTEVEPPPPSPPPPPPPSDDWLESPELPGFRVQVRISAGGDSIPGRREAACIPETLCVSGALAGRSEVFVRVVGPKPNGFLWPTLVKFTTSTAEVWIERPATGELRYYRLEGASPGSSDLPGLFDRTGFSGD